MRPTLPFASACSLAFGLLGLGYWTAPDVIGRHINLAALDGLGLASLQADLGGLFLSLAVLGAVGVINRRRAPLIAASLVLCLIVAARLAAWAVHGELGGLALALPLEIAGLFAFAAHARSLDAWKSTAPLGRVGRALRIGALAAFALVAIFGVSIVRQPAERHADLSAAGAFAPAPQKIWRFV